MHRPEQSRAAHHRLGVAPWIIAVAILAQAPAAAQSTTNTPDAVSEDASAAEITVTARRRAERLVDVPDSITAISSAVIERANITSLGNISVIVPNLNLRNNASFGSSGLVMSMRGIANGQNGWPSVAFLVDGVPVDSLEDLIGTNLEDLQQIEVMRGPQSAVYGANAIAGAINITTRQPTDELSGRVQIDYANGNDKKAAAALAGTIAPDLAQFRISLSRRKADGLIDSASNGLHLQGTDDWRLRGQLLVTPTDRLTLSFVGDYSNTEHGAVYQYKIPTRADFDNALREFKARRRFAGIEDRDYQKYSLKADYDFGSAQLVSITAYSKTHQHLTSSGCYDDPDSPTLDNGDAAGTQIICVANLQVYGSAAVAGQAVDQAYIQDQRFESFYQDSRLQSNGSGPFKWMIGGSYLWRQTRDGYNFGAIIAGPQGGAGCATGYGLDLSGCQGLNLLFNRWDKRQDHWWGVYGQLAYEISPGWELTAAGRYDDQRYRDTRYSTDTFAVIVPVTRPDGTVSNSLLNKANKFQPKAQLSFKPSRDFTLYASWSKGFRAGYYNYGQFVSPEATTNYEVGAKGRWASPLGEARFSAALFHIDYSNQQFTTSVAAPPFIQAVVIPKTKIDGGEAELSLIPVDGITLSGSLGYLDSKTAAGRRSPYAPKLTTNLSVSVDQPLSDNVSLIGYANWNRRSSQQLTVAAPDQLLAPKNFIDVRGGLRFGNFELEAFAENLTNEREAITPATALGTAFFRSINLPRRYGVNAKYKF